MGGTRRRAAPQAVAVQFRTADKKEGERIMARSRVSCNADAGVAIVIDLAKLVYIRCSSPIIFLVTLHTLVFFGMCWISLFLLFAANCFPGLAVQRFAFVVKPKFAVAVVASFRTVGFHAGFVLEVKHGSSSLASDDVGDHDVRA